MEDNQVSGKSNVWLLCSRCKEKLAQIRHMIQNNKVYIIESCSCSKKLNKIPMNEYFSKVKNIEITPEKFAESQLCQEHKGQFAYHCKDCSTSLCPECYASHNKEHRIVQFSEISFTEGQLEDLHSAFEKAKNNSIINNSLGYQFITDKIHELISKLNVQLEDLEKEFKLNQAINENLIYLVDMVFYNYFLASKNTNNYALIQNINNNTQFNLNQYDINITDDTILKATSNFTKFLKNNFVIRRSSTELKVSDEFQEIQSTIKCIIKSPNNQLGIATSSPSLYFLKTNPFGISQALNSHLRGITTLINCVVEDNNYIFSGGEDGTIKVWGGETEENSNYLLITTISAHDSKITKLISLSEGKIASSSWDRTIKIWDISALPNYRNVLTIEDSVSDIKSIIELQDHRIVSVSADKKLKIYTIERNGRYNCDKEISHIFIGTNNSIIQLEDSRLCIGGNSNIKLLSINSYEIEGILKGHELWVNVVKQLKDGTVISGSSDQSVRVWDLSSEKCLFVLKDIGIINDVCEIEEGEIVAGTYEGRVLRLKSK